MKTLHKLILPLVALAAFCFSTTPAQAYWGRHHGVFVWGGGRSYAGYYGPAYYPYYNPYYGYYGPYYGGGAVVFGGWGGHYGYGHHGYYGHGYRGGFHR